MRNLGLSLFLLACTVDCAHALNRGHAQTPDALYEAAVDDLESGLYPEALKQLAEIKAKFPYSRFAALADLRTADTHFKRNKYQEAIDAYRNFLKFHPNHDEAAYAMFRIGEAYHEQIPGDWWFMPPAAEKDQASTRMAISAYQDMLARFDKDPMAATAVERLNACRRKLADHEIYVARFYFTRARYTAAALRAEGLLHDYPGLGLDKDALWLAGKSRFEQGDPVAAAVALRRLSTEFAETQEGRDAAALLEKLGPHAEGATSGAPKT